MHPAPFFKASFIKLSPLFFFPLIVKNKLSFFTSLESIESPSKLTCLVFPNNFFNISLLCKNF